MANVHDYFGGHSLQAETGRASSLLIGTMMGGMLALNSYLAGWFYGDPIYSTILAMLGAILLGLPILLEALEAAFKGEANLDVLVAIAVVAAFAIGDYQTAAVVSFFFHLSNLIEKRTALGARASIESLIRLSPKTAHLLDPQTGKEREVSVKELKLGDIVRVRPGDNIPADGQVKTGESSVSQASITGESLPVDKHPNDEVFSGTINLNGSMDIRVTRVGADTTLGQVQKLILQAEGTKIPIMRLIDQYAHWYVPTILMLAGIVLVFTHEMTTVITILIVACPCALILATPTAMVAGLACAARLGILIKSVTDLEAARTMTAVVLDKTGTLTTGELTVTRLKPAANIDPADLLAVAAGLEHRSKHPVAKAVAEVAHKAKINLTEPNDFVEIPGLGVKGKLNSDLVMVGRRKWLESQNIDFASMKSEEFAEPEGISVLYVSRNGRCIGWIGLEDRVRPEAKSAISELHQLGIKRLAMVTGDRWSVARRVAAEMGCDEVQAEVLPQEKLNLVAELKQSGHKVIVVGDGVNDAPALAAGDLGVAMGAAGSDVAIHSASIALLSSDLSKLPFLIRLSRAVTRIVWLNLGFGVLFICVMLLLAILGEIGPITGVLLHTLGSVVVIFNSARLVRFGEDLGTFVPQQRESEMRPATV
ncbi:MAG: cation-translocating P-type ATPase [Phycisphaerae bacterium]